MLKHEFRNKFIHTLRMNGYSKKKSVTVYRKFLVNLSKAYGDPDYVISHTNIISSMLYGGFIWKETEQGHAYWDAVAGHFI